MKADFDSFVYNEDIESPQLSKPDTNLDNQYDKMINNFRKRTEDIADCSKVSDNSHVNPKVSVLTASKAIKKKSKATVKTWVAAQ